MEGDIILGKNEQVEFDILSQFVNGKIFRREAATLLDVDERTITRKVSKIREKGLLGLIHGNRGKSPKNKTALSLRDEVMDLVEKNYFDFNMTHSLEILRKDHKIEVEYSTFRRWCHDKHLVKKKHGRRPVIRSYRVRMPNEGYLLQMDGSHHKFNGEDEWCLILAIDDATSEIPYGEFFLSESTINCMRVLQKIIEKKGMPYALYVDRAGWSGGGKRTDFAQFKRACEELGIRVLFANSAEAKGRVERSFKTIQDRLIPEMRIRNIHQLPAGNDYLQNQFLPNYWNSRNVVPARSLETRYQKLPMENDLNQIFCIKEYRKVKGDNTISYEGKIYQLYPFTKFSLRGHEVEIRVYQDKSWKVYFAQRELELKRINYLDRAA